MLSIGLIVNPVAGIGGPAGLAGSDGFETQQEALRRGARPLAGQRADRFLKQLERLRPDAEVTVAPAGAERPLGTSSAEDTKAAAQAMVRSGAAPDVIVFVGGDGTARDVHDAVSGDIPVLGVPAGVKMQSAVFARSPEAAAALLADWSGDAEETEFREVADIDEVARREGRVVSQVWGELRVPLGRQHLQGGKVGQSRAVRGSLPGLAAGLAEWLDPDKAWLMGPGSTVRGVSEALGLSASLLGVDLHLPAREGERASHLDLSAAEIDAILAERGVEPQVVVSPVGGQGFVLGRGNQQLDAAILDRLDRTGLLIISTPAKLSELGGGPLYADLPAGTRSRGLLGPHRVITGRNDTAMIQLLAA